MFRCKTAWFSSSVPQSYVSFWISEGGTVAGWRTADYLFSEDATCPDTLRVFQSKAYLWNKMTVFHSSFLSTCAKRQSVMSVCIGHYVLPPASVQDEVRNVVGRFIWECEDEPSVAQGSLERSNCLTEAEYSEEEDSRSNSEPPDTDSSENEDPLCGHLQNYSFPSMLTGYINVNDLPKYSGDLWDFHPGCFRCSKCEAHCCCPQT